MAILEAKNVGMHFGELAALQNINLSVEKGEILGLIGPNGAGKTTFFNCVTGFLNATRGDIFFNGQNITRPRAPPDLPPGHLPDVPDRAEL